VERTLRLIAADLTHLSLRTLQLAHNFYSACAPPESAQGWDLSWVDVDPQARPCRPSWAAQCMRAPLQHSHAVPLAPDLASCATFNTH